MIILVDTRTEPSDVGRRIETLMDKRAKSIFLATVLTAALLLLWYKRVIIAIPYDERLVFLAACGLGFLMTGLLLDFVHKALDRRLTLLLLLVGVAVCSALAVAPDVLHTVGLVGSGLCAGGAFLILIVHGLRLLPANRRGLAFASCFALAGFINTTTDIAEFPALQVSGALPNLVMATLSALVALIVAFWRGQVFNTRLLPISDSDGDTESVRHMIVTGGLALAAFALLFISTSFTESVAYPAAVTQLPTSGLIRYIELPLWAIAAYITDFRSRRTMVLTCLIAAFIGAASTLNLTSPAINAVATLCTYLCLIGFPTACCSILIDVSYFSRYPLLLGFLCFVPVVIGELFSFVLNPLIAGLSSDIVYLLNLGVLVLFAAVTVLLAMRVQADAARFRISTSVMEIADQKSGAVSPAAVSKQYNFTTREAQIFGLILQNLTVRQMAEDLVVSESTVKFHITNMLKKTNAVNRSDMLQKLQKS